MRSLFLVWASMILEAAKLSAGKGSPIPYMQGVLANRKNNSVYTLEGTEKSAKESATSQEEYNREYARRRDKALQTAQVNLERAMEENGFSELYSRLNSIERDLAFAEINQNEDALKVFEKEKTEITKKATDILAKINLTLKDIYPRYACEKCNDTGYVGTHRCDCYDLKV